VEKYVDLEKKHQDLQKAYKNVQDIVKLLILEESGIESGAKLDGFFDIVGGRTG
jgi:hypothetical protein